MQTIADDIKRYAPIISLSRILSRSLMRRLRLLFFALAILTGLTSIGAFLLPSIPFITFELTLGLCFIFTALWIEQVMLYAYHNSYYFHGLNSILGLSENPVSGVTYEVASALSKHSADVTYAFVTSSLGMTVLLRSGVDGNQIADFLASERPRLTTNMITLPVKSLFSLITLGEYLLKQDPAFAGFLKKNSVIDENFLGALRFVILSHHNEKRRERWWSKDNLSQTKGIGREWSYGTPYLLEKFSRDLRTSAVYANLTSSDNTAFTNAKIEEIEVALARAKAANVLVIGEPGVGKIDLLLEVEKRLTKGVSIGSLVDTRLVLLDTARLFAVHNDKQTFEQTLLSLFAGAAQAGNIIIVIENMSTFIREAENLGTFIPELLDPFLASPSLHVIGTDTPGAYHTYLEPLGGFARRFAEVLIDAPDLSSTTRVLEGIALKNEGRFRTLFTYPALVAITQAADRYLVEGVMPDKAIELLVDIATRAAAADVGIITPDFVHTVVSERTGIPIGPITNEEKDLLLRLEDRLRERVIGQDRALDAIARTMRRARAGIQSADKPIGSFLFLGPTGVGKTETAKALAYIFFGAETAMLRFDMSEFSSHDALTRLNGDRGRSGLLPDKLREHPYAVILLDEFEKASRAVHDLFLQILDEGVFTDGRGEKVNARNTIIIATSNAGSQLILKTVSVRQELASLTEEIIHHIVREGTFRPELLNRFDNTIIFDPLSIEEQGQIASLMLKGLYERIRERGYQLTLNRDLIDVLVEKGYSPKFGARPMQRVLQDIVEEKVAKQIISGSVSPGGTITLSRADFTDQELAV